jgi:hypothetical protein
MTQVQIGQQLGISQMHVSRLLAHALGYLRPRLLGLPQREPGTARTAAPGPDLTRAAASRRRAPGVSPASLPGRTEYETARRGRWHRLKWIRC